MTDTIKANKVARVLSGRQLKFSCVLHKKDGTVFEFQSDDKPQIAFNAIARIPVLVYGKYDEVPICPWDEVSALFCEPNPGTETSS
jgi:hypothetical protein